MRRPRRHRWLTVSVFFIAYSVLQAVFTASTASEPAVDINLPEEVNSPVPADTKDEIEKDATRQRNDATPTEPTEKSPDEAVERTTETEDIEEEEDGKKTMKDAGYKEPINVLAAGAQAFHIDGIRIKGHDPQLGWLANDWKCSRDQRRKSES
ncbi:hypothetical protein evm_002640 [Chilo suppressalis]|nr:hypothetical protein evm_002640 [Chilo suppressalis]